MHGAYVCRLPVRYVHALPVNGDAMKNHDIVRTSVCGLLSAASLALLAVGSFSGTLELSAAAAASLAVVYIRIEFGTVPALSVYACVSLLSLLLLPQKTGALVYALGAGAYPVFKAFAESRFRAVPGWILKLAFFNAALTLVIAAGTYLLSLSLGFGFAVLTYIAANAAFVVYDVALTMLITLYFRRFRGRR